MKEQSVGAGLEVLADPGAFGGREAAVERHRGDTGLTQSVDLVLHEGDQGADHHVETFRDQRGHLVGEALAAAGGHHQQRIVALEVGLDRLALQGAQLVEAPVAGQHVGDRGVHGCDIHVE